MPNPRRLMVAFLLLIFSGVSALAADSGKVIDPLGWAAPTRENHPWTRWWWLGSAVDQTNLSRQLRLFKEAGIGGVEICPIYGAKGYEDQFIEFLSPKWMEMLDYTTTEAKKLDLGVDLTTGTGWPFGGPRVTPEFASGRLVLRRYNVSSGERLGSPLPEGRLQCLRAFGEQGEQIELTDRVQGGRLEWTAPAGNWRLYAVAEVSPVQKVKRAAPGGEGNVLDPFSTAAMDHYLADFDRHFAAYHGETPRAQFHDSYEYYGAQWTPAFFREFAARSGYDLRTQLPAILEEGPPEIVGRVRSDFRETLANLHLAYIERWTAWAHRHGSLSREQAHGSPSDLLDVYAAADIPETEVFGAVSELELPLNKFSSSAAHVSGRVLASSESFTWLSEHFNATLSQVKQAADYLFLTGVNHLFFHGIPYSPAEAPWPGWQFYAAVNFGPEGGLWRDLPEFNAYVTRCESVLQSGESANDVLLYYNVFDAWDAPGNLIIPNPLPSSLTNSALSLWNRGYGFDYLSDRFLAQAEVSRGRVMLGGHAYQVVLTPPCRLMPPASLERLLRLARSGATIAFVDQLPEDVPGLANLEDRRAAFRALRDTVKLGEADGSGLRRAALSRGTVLVGANADLLLHAAGVMREPMVDEGLRFVRRAHAEGYHYLIANRGEHAVDGWVTLGTTAKTVVILDPESARPGGIASLRQGPDGVARVYLQLLPGESRILRSYTDKSVTGAAWPALEPSGRSYPITGSWQVRFIEGGPELPAAFNTSELCSWTSRDDAEAKRFAGTASYRIEFDRPAQDADDWILDLGRICETARVKLNGREVGALWCAPYRISVGHFLRAGKNTLELEVTNLAANRIRDLDARQVKWKYFYDANLASQRQRSGLDASVWPLRDSGLLGPVELAPMRTVEPK
jgi:hypothetical protein